MALLVIGAAAPSSAREVCRFAGITDHAGRAAVTTDVSAAEGLTRVDVVVTFEATTMLVVPIRYLIEEVSTWRGGELESVAVNNRYLFAGRIVRQQWDEFRRGTTGLEAHRVQAKTLADFQARHPGFVQHWDPGTFGMPWLPDYQAAAPERRPDLDLGGAELPAGLRSPFAMAFWWVRWLPRGGEEVPVFLPGFKADKIADLPIAGAPADGGMRWRVPLRYKAFSENQASTATARTSADRRLLEIAFEVHGTAGSARGLIREAGCDGAPVVPKAADQ
jgi:hypothetical protein